MWNFERKWAKNNFLICRALWGNGVVWVCLRGGGDADWVSCWLSWLTMWLNQWIVGIVDRVGWFGWWLCMFSLGLGVQWVGWLYFDSGGRWLGHCVQGRRILGLVLLLTELDDVLAEWWVEFAWVGVRVLGWVEEWWMNEQCVVESLRWCVVGWVDGWRVSGGAIGCAVEWVGERMIEWAE